MFFSFFLSDERRKRGGRGLFFCSLFVVFVCCVLCVGLWLSVVCCLLSARVLRVACCVCCVLRVAFCRLF